MATKFDITYNETGIHYTADSLPQRFRLLTAGKVTEYDIYVSVSEIAPVITNYLHFSAPAVFRIGSGGNRKTWDGKLYYATDADHSQWNLWDGTAPISAALSNGAYHLYLAGSGNSVITGSYSNYWEIRNNSGYYATNISCEGNTESLLDWEMVANGRHPPMGPYCFAYLFRFSGLISLPSLGAVDLSTYCYYGMFYGCTIGAIPDFYLPAQYLALGCYLQMFRECSSLTTVNPYILSSVKYLADSSCYMMFYNCSALTNHPILPNATLANSCYSGMFGYCTALAQLCPLRATALAPNCYSYMYQYCSKIKLQSSSSSGATTYRIPISGTGYTAYSCVDSMFTGTGGAVKSVAINTTYYTTNTIVS